MITPCRKAPGRGHADSEAGRSTPSDFSPRPVTPGVWPSIRRRPSSSLRATLPRACSTSRAARSGSRSCRDTGKEAVVAMLEAGDFFGEGCLAGQPLRMATATAIDADHAADRREAEDASAAARASPASPIASSPTCWPATSASRKTSSTSCSTPARSGSRARCCCWRATAKQSKPQRVLPKLSQEMLAEMVGTTRSRVNFFMNKFRKLGFIEYNGGLEDQQLAPERRPPRLTTPPAPSARTYRLPTTTELPFSRSAVGLGEPRSIECRRSKPGVDVRTIPTTFNCEQSRAGPAGYAWTGGIHQLDRHHSD